jgi:hypothetical protein
MIKTFQPDDHSFLMILLHAVQTLAGDFDIEFGLNRQGWRSQRAEKDDATVELLSGRS